MDTSKLSYALEHAALGIEVLPVWGIDGAGKCACGVDPCKWAGKHPIGFLAVHGHKSATTDLEVIRDWWVQYPDANIGGRVPVGMVVVDVDQRKGGHTSLYELTEQNGMLPETRTTITSDGWHYWFRHDGPTTGWLPAGLDKRTNKNFVVLPGSRHHSGVSYQWGKELEIAPAPTWLADMLSAGPDRAVTTIAKALPVSPTPDWEQLVRTGVPKGQRSTAQVALVHPIITAGGTEDDYVSLISDPNNGISERYWEIARSRGQDYADEQLRYWWNRYAGDHKPGLPQPEHITQDIDHIRDDLVTMLDTNELGRMLAMWWAVGDIAVTHRTYKPILPVRTMAELAGVSKDNGANRSLRRFVALGALRPAERADGDRSIRAAQAYQISTPWRQTLSTVEKRITRESVIKLDGFLRYWTPPNLAVWRERTARGKLAWVVHSSGDPSSSRSDEEIAAALDIPVARVRKMTSLLERDGLFAPSNDGWIVTDVDPESLSFPDAERAIRNQQVRYELDRRALHGDRLSQSVEWTATDVTRREAAA